MRTANSTDQPNEKPVDLTELRLKKLFVETVNDYINCFNNLNNGSEFQKYYSQTIIIQLTISRVFEWYDIADLIETQVNHIINCRKPNQIIWENYI